MKRYQQKPNLSLEEFDEYNRLKYTLNNIPMTVAPELAEKIKEIELNKQHGQT